VSFIFMKLYAGLEPPTANWTERSESMAWRHKRCLGGWWKKDLADRFLFWGRSSLPTGPEAPSTCAYCTIKLWSCRPRSSLQLAFSSPGSLQLVFLLPHPSPLTPLIAPPLSSRDPSVAMFSSDKGSGISTNADSGLMQEARWMGVITRMVFSFSGFSVFMGFSSSLILATISMYLFGFEKVGGKGRRIFFWGGGIEILGYGRWAKLTAYQRKTPAMKTALPHQPQYHENQKQKQIKNVNSQ